jgi:hypothetical protein
MPGAGGWRLELSDRDSQLGRSILASESRDASSQLRLLLGMTEAILRSLFCASLRGLRGSPVPGPRTAFAERHADKEQKQNAGPERSRRN